MRKGSDRARRWSEPRLRRDRGQDVTPFVRIEIQIAPRDVDERCERTELWIIEGTDAVAGHARVFPCAGPSTTLIGAAFSLLPPLQGLLGAHDDGGIRREKNPRREEPDRGTY